MSSPTASVSGSLSAFTRVEFATPEENPDAHFIEKKAILEKILNAKSEEDCRYKPHFKPNPPQSNCFGPQIFFENKPINEGPGPCFHN